MGKTDTGMMKKLAEIRTGTIFYFIAMLAFFGGIILAVCFWIAKATH
jgi:hypothetical protein